MAGPVLIATSPAEDATDFINAAGDILLAFNEPVVRSNTGTIVITTPSGSTIDDSVGGPGVQVIGNGVLYAFPFTTPGTYQVVFPANLVEDSNGNPNSTPITLNFTIPASAGPDVAPTLLLYSGEAGTTGAAASITLAFSEPVKAGSGSIELFSSNGTLVDQVPITSSSVSITNDMISIAGVPFQFGQSYYLLIDSGAVTDDAGTPFAGVTSPSTVQFAIPAAAPAPQLVSMTPADNGSDVGLAPTISLTFSENVIVGSGDVEIHLASTGQVVETLGPGNPNYPAYLIGEVGDQITYSSYLALQPDTQYYVTIDSSAIVNSDFVPFAGISSPQGYTFTTKALTDLGSATGSFTVNTDAQLGSGETLSFQDNSTSDEAVLQLVPPSDGSNTMIFCNYGTISGQLTTNGELFGVYANDGDSASFFPEFSNFENFGTVQVTGPTQQTDPPITPTAIGFYDAAIPFTNESAGQIIATGNTAYGVYANGVAPFTNNGLIEAIGTLRADGIDFSEDMWSLTNSGTIEANGGDGAATVAVENYIGGFTALINTGTIEASAAANAQEATAIFAYDAESIVNSGTISAPIAIRVWGIYATSIVSDGRIDGDIDLASGNSTVDLRGGTMSGTIFIAATSSASDTIYTGNNTIPIDISSGNSGASVTIYGTAGAGSSLVLSGVASTSATESYNWSTGAWTVTSADGTDTLYNVAAVEFTDTTLTLPTPPPSPAPTDFGGTGISDLLWQNTDGSVAIWTMIGTNVTAGTLLGNVGPTWHVITTGQFFGGNDADILWQNNDGTVAIWEMNGSTLVTGGLIGSNPGATWHVMGAGDFTGDGESDILFQNNDGSIAIWEMNGFAVTNGILVGNPGSTWHVEGVGDFNGDGKSDLLLQNDDGTIAIWEMNGGSIVAGSIIGSNPGPTWHVAGVGDFNGDGYSDILLQNTDGTIAIWEMNGFNIIASAIVANPGSSWKIVGVGDYNGDGKSDILFQNTNGQEAIWEMNGFRIVGSSLVSGDPGSTWQLQGNGGAPYQIGSGFTIPLGGDSVTPSAASAAILSAGESFAQPLSGHANSFALLHAPGLH